MRRASAVAGAALIGLGGLLVDQALGQACQAHRWAGPEAFLPPESLDTLRQPPFAQIFRPSRAVSLRNDLTSVGRRGRGSLRMRSETVIGRLRR